MLDALDEDVAALLAARLERLTVQIALPADRPHLRRIVLADAEDMLSSAPANARAMMVSVSVEGRLNLGRRGHPEALTLLLFIQGAAIGMLMLDRPAPRQLSLLELVIIPEYRRRGLGTEVLSAICAMTDRAGEIVSTAIFYDSPAIRLLRRAGFTVQGEDGLDLVMSRRPGG